MSLISGSPAFGVCRTPVCCFCVVGIGITFALDWRSSPLTFEKIYSLLTHTSFFGIVWVGHMNCLLEVPSSDFNFVKLQENLIFNP